MELSRARVLYLLLTTHLRVYVPDRLQVLFGIVVLIGVGVGGGIATTSFGMPLFTLLWVLMAGLCLCAFVLRYGPSAGWNTPVLALDEHPRLKKVLLEAVELTGAETVPKIRLHFWPTAGLQVGTRRRLLIGLPLVMELPDDEMRALMVRSLLIPRLWSWRDEWIGSLNRWDLRRAKSGRPHPDRALLRAHAQRQREDLWGAAAALVGRETLARAMRREFLMGHAFTWFVDRYVALWADPSWGYPTDVYSAFSWKIRQDGLLERMERVVDACIALEDRHEAELFTGLGWHSGAPVGAATAHVAGPLPDRLLRRMGHVLWRELQRQEPPFGVKGSSIRDKPAELWALYAEGKRIQIIAAATLLLGRPATAGDVVRLAVEGRAAELEGWREGRACPHPTPAGLRAGAPARRGAAKDRLPARGPLSAACARRADGRSGRRGGTGGPGRPGHDVRTGTGVWHD